MQLVDAWMRESLVRPWAGRIGSVEKRRVTAGQGSTDRFVGVPRMTAVPRHLAASLKLSFAKKVSAIKRDRDKWRVVLEAGDTIGPYDAVILTTPPEQAFQLLADAPQLASRIASVKSSPCWAVMTVFSPDVPLPLDGVFVRHPALAWAARNASKPGRPPAACWVLHGTAEWSRTFLEADPSIVGERLLAAFFEATGQAPTDVVYLKAHRWRYARVETPLEVGCLWDDRLKVGACGDWCLGTRVEGAALSGLAMANRVVSSYFGG